MDDKWLILIVAAMAHIYLALSFAPRYWEPLRRRGPSFWTLIAPLGLPVILGFMLLLKLVENWNGLPGWIQLLGGLGVGAVSANLIVSSRVLRAVRAKKSS
jgi:hypothetical protein